MQTRTKALFPLVLIISACVTDEVPLDEAPRGSPAEITTEESVIADPSIGDEEEVEIVYREGSASMEILVNVEKFARTAPGSTVEIQIDVTTAEGVTTHHDLDWTHGALQEIPRIEAPVLHDGLYEVVVTELAIDGRVLDRPLTRQRMDVRGDHDLYTHPHDDDDGGWEEDDDDDGGHDGGDWDDDDDDGGHDGGDWDDDDDDDDDGGHDGGGWEDDDDDGGWDDGGGHGGPKCKKGKEKHGSDYADKLRGTERNDTLYGRDGKDKLWGYECHDRLYGGNGRDTLKGGQGNDFLHGGKGDDSCIGGKGKDEFRSCEYIQH